MIHEQFLPVSRGGILYDAARLRKPDAAWFSRDYWRAQSAIKDMAGGRGSVSILHSPEGDWILRHYKRGGFIANLSRDRYWWYGADATRSFREFRLLAHLSDRGLPVPTPIAARYVRAALTYRADLITVRLDALTLAQTLTRRALDASEWHDIGRTIARFHAVGVHHADLNANNIMLGAGGVHLIDFDRGRIRVRGAWEQAVLARLRRSLDKLKKAQPSVPFGDAQWEALRSGAATL